MTFSTDDNRLWHEDEFGFPWENEDTYREISIISDVGNVETPLLVTADEEDWRCPPMQAGQLYVSVKTQGVDAKLVDYQNEHHNIGDPTALSAVWRRSRTGSNSSEPAPINSASGLTESIESRRRPDLVSFRAAGDGTVTVADGVTEAALSQSDTGVTITVSETYADVYEVAPLAYYLGATVEPGDPAIHLDNGYTHHFSRDEPLAHGVESVLARAFFFDTLARIGGYNALPRTEYEAVAADLPFYPENLYDASIPDALIEYLEVDLNEITDVFPRWPTVGVLPDSLDGVELLAPVLDMLAPIRVRSADSLLAAGHALGPDGPLPGIARTPPVAFANARAPAPPVVEDTHVVVVSDAVDRRRALSSVRESDACPALPADRLTVTDSLDGVERADALVLDTDNAPARDAVASLSPRVLLARDTGCAPVNALFDRGLVTALAYGDLRVDALARLLAALAVTFPVTDALDAAGVDRDCVRVTGLPYASLCRRAGGGYPIHLDAHSTSPDDHDVTVRLPVAHFGLGSVSNHDHRLLRDDYALSGRTARLPTVLTTTQFVELARDINGVVWLNDTHLAGVHPLTEDAVRENARRSLADPAENDQRLDK